MSSEDQKKSNVKKGSSVNINGIIIGTQSLLQSCRVMNTQNHNQTRRSSRELTFSRSPVK